MSKIYSQIILVIVLLGLFLGFMVLRQPSPLKAPRIVNSSAVSNSLFFASNKEFSVKIGERNTNKPVIEYSLPTGNKISFSYKNTGDKTSTPEEKNNIITFKNVSPDVDLRYTTLPTGLKEELVLNKQATNNIFVFDLNLTNAFPETQTDTLFSGTFKDSMGNYLFHFEKPYALDAKGNRTDNVALQIKKDKTNSYSLSLTVDKTWLESRDRVYPVVIDPTIVHDTTSEFSTGQFNRTIDTGSGASPNLTTYYQELSSDINTVGVWHMNNDWNDASENGLDGTATNAVFSTSSMLGSHAGSFDGAGDYVTIDDNPILDTGSITIEAWIKRSTLGVTDRIITRDHSGTGAVFVFQVNAATNYLSFYVTTAGDIGSNMNCTGTTVVDTNWHHVAVTYNQTISKAALYIDGRLDVYGTPGSTNCDSGATMFSGPLIASDQPLYIGRTDWSGTSYYMTGLIDEVRLSNIARQPEEIKLAAQRRPYSIHTSDEIDLTYAFLWSSISWTELGVNTGDGETLYSSTNLYGQWNFNETSGTAADNAEGTSARDGTLTNFASTGSQDAATDSGWTAANKRWGAGALMFDGLNDYVTLGDQNTVDTATALTVCAWVNHNSSTTDGYIAAKTVSDGGWRFLRDDVGSVSTRTDIYTVLVEDSADTDSARIEASSNTASSGLWNHVCFTYAANSATGLHLYINGKEDSNSPVSTSGISAIDGTTAALTMGAVSNGTSPLSGFIDSTTIYTRVLSASEILSNYQAGNIELQTRIGNTANADDGTWEAWRTITGETQVDSMDGPYLYNTTDSGLVSYWPMEDAVGTTVGDVKGTNHGTAANATVAEGAFGIGRAFYGSADTISIANPANFSFERTNAFSIEAWVKTSSSSTNNIFSKMDNAAPFTGYDFYISSSGKPTFILVNTWSTNTIAVNTTTRTVNDGYWHHVVLTYSGSSAASGVIIYVDGKAAATTTTADTLSATTVNAITPYIGSRNNLAYYFTGMIDEVRVYNSAISATTVLTHYQQGSTNPNFFHPSTDTTTKMEGTASEKFQTGAVPVDPYTIGLWHFEETAGTGSYLQDSSSNNYDGTPTGTDVVDGYIGKGRNFNGTSDLIQVQDQAAIVFPITVSAWVYVNDCTAYRPIYQSDPNASTSYGIWFQVTNTCTLQISDGDGLGTGPTHRYTKTSTALVPTNSWVHLTGVMRSHSDMSVYINGVDAGGAYTGTGAAIASSSDIATIGGNTTFFDGIIDEVQVSNIARSDQEINEAYRAGRDHYISRTISSTDFSTITSLPFYIASDRQGTFIDAIVGESAYANGQTNATALGIWRLDEASGSGSYLKDMSGNGYHCTPTGSLSVQGKNGKGRKFTYASAENLSCGSPSIANGSFTLEAWVNRTGTGNINYIFGQGTAGASTGLHFGFIATNIFRFGFYSADLDTKIAYPETNAWHYWVGTYDASTNARKIYYDGVLIASDSPAADYSGTGEFWISGAPWGSGRTFDGIIDEARLSSNARSADAIRQSYEMGLRTHSITIDFKAKLDSSNSITDTSDLSFTVDSTAYGASSMGSNLYLGDKIIIKENYDGTEYISQGTVNSLNVSTGAVTVVAWDSGSTAPPSVGFSVNATVFKWQREYFDVRRSITTHRDTVTSTTLRLSSGSQGANIWLDDFRTSSGYLTTPAGSTITSSLFNRYFQYRVLETSFDTAVSPSISMVTLNYTSNVPPNLPTLDAPTNTAADQLLLPVLRTTSTDTDSDVIKYKIELCTNVDMTTGCQTFNQVTSATGWSAASYASGVQGVYTLQSALSAGTTYYWRSYAIDEAGTNTWSTTQAVPYSFITSYVPATVTLLTPADTAANISVKPVFTFSTTDTDSDYLRYKLLICTDSGMTLGCETFDQTSSQTNWSGQNAESNTAYTSGTTATYTHSTTALDTGQTYYWQAFAIDPAGSITWSPAPTRFSFTTKDSPATPAPCSFVKAFDNSNITINWTDTATENNFQVWKAVDAGVPAQLGGNLAADTIQLVDSAISLNHYYAYLIRGLVIDGSYTYYSEWCSTATTYTAEDAFYFEGLKMEGIKIN